VALPDNKNNNDFLIRTCFFREELYRNATWASRKKDHNVVSGWIAVLRLFTLLNPPEEGRKAAFNRVKEYRLE